MNAQANVVFLGRSGAQPGLVMVAEGAHGLESVEVAEFPAGHSVYALAVAPDGLRAGAATKKGLVWVCDLTDLRATPNSKPVMEVLHIPGVASLAFCNGDLLASGGLDGTIKFWSIPDKKQVAEVRAHSGAVLSMCRIGTLLLASVGADAALRIWDLDSLEAKFSREGLDLPKFGALMRLQYDPFSGLLFHPSGRGNLHAYDVVQGRSQITVTAHQGDCCAIADNGQRVATAGAEDGMLKIWSPALDNLEFEAPAGSGIVSLGWIGVRRLAAIASTGSGRIWTIENSLRPEIPVEGGPFRACLGLPPEVVAACLDRERRQWRDAGMKEAAELIKRTDAEAKQRLAVLSQEFHARGFSMEAHLVAVEAGRAQGEPLEELKALMELSRSLGETPAAVPTLYTLADLLTRLREPALAVEFLGKVVSLEPDHRDAKQRLAVLRSAPILDPSSPELIRADLATPELFAAELGKCTILGRKFASPVLREPRPPLVCNAVIHCDRIREVVAESLEQMFPGQQSVQSRPARLLLNGHARASNWVYVRSTCWPAAYALEVKEAGGRCQLTPHTVFEPTSVGIPDSLSIAECNQAVKNSFVALFDSADVKTWLDGIHRKVLEVLNRLMACAASENRDGLF